MKRLAIVIALTASVLFAGTALGADNKAAKKGNPAVVIKTSMGTIEAVLYKDKAPISVENFLKYVEDTHYDGTIFHRVIPNFMIQGGGFNAKFSQKKTRDPIKNEAKNGLKNERGTFAMARTSQVDSATCQFFINLKHNKSLDNDARGFGYAVFGKVTRGMDVVDKIAKVQTGAKGSFSRDCPKEDITIESVRVK
jgi:cyclophilin family peptidyl-prolyl cis-trans isomerase